MGAASAWGRAKLFKEIIPEEPHVRGRPEVGCDSSGNQQRPVGKPAGLFIRKHFIRKSYVPKEPIMGQ